MTVQGVGLGGLRVPGSRLDLGNSGTGARLLLGVLSGGGLETTISPEIVTHNRRENRVECKFRENYCQGQPEADT